ncbi:MAG: AbrB/MazE/SpoVT family DNA-binding domain-containing protein [Promethearchaeota archaeon]
MRDAEILRIDSRGRIVIPRSFRKTLGLKEGSQIMLISDPNENELRLVPLPFTDQTAFMRMRILMPDEPGALGKVSKVIGEMGLSLIYGQEIILKKGEAAEWNVIAPIPDMPMEEFKKIVIEKGGAKSVTIEVPNKP